LYPYNSRILIDFPAISLNQIRNLLQYPKANYIQDIACSSSMFCFSLLKKDELHVVKVNKVTLGSRLNITIPMHLQRQNSKTCSVISTTHLTINNLSLF